MWFLDVLAALFGLLILIGVVATWRLRRTWSWGDVFVTMRLGLRSRRPRRMLILGLLGLVSAGTIVAGADLLPPVLLGVWVASSLLAIASVVTPPSILFLGASKASCLELLAGSAGNAVPLRTVHLLRYPELDPVMSQQVGDDSVRTMDDAHWREQVDAFARLAPVIVLDTRSSTTFVQEELERFASSPARARVLFVVDPSDANSPFAQALHALGMTGRESLRIISPAGLLDLTARLGWKALFGGTPPELRAMAAARLTEGAAPCARCGRSLHLGQRPDLGMDMGMGTQARISAHSSASAPPAAVECVACETLYCASCAQVELGEASGRIVQLSMNIKCACGSTRFQPIPGANPD